MLRVIGALIVMGGIYLILVEKQFFGIFFVIIGFVILPSLENRKSPEGRQNETSNPDDSIPSNKVQKSQRVYDSDRGSGN